VRKPQNSETIHPRTTIRYGQDGVASAVGNFAIEEPEVPSRPSIDWVATAVAGFEVYVCLRSLRRHNFSPSTYGVYSVLLSPHTLILDVPTGSNRLIRVKFGSHTNGPILLECN